MTYGGDEYVKNTNYLSTLSVVVLSNNLSKKLLELSHVRLAFEASIFEVIDALVSLSCRSNISAEILWDGGWLLRQLLPYSVSEFNSHHLELLKVSYKSYASSLVEEVRGIWSDLLISVLCDEWRKCKRAMESSSPRKEPNCILLLRWKISSGGHIPEGSSLAAGKRMHELVKVFVLLHQLQIFTLGRTLTEQPLIYPPGELPANCRAQGSGLDVSGLFCNIPGAPRAQQHVRLLQPDAPQPMTSGPPPQSRLDTRAASQLGCCQWGSNP